MAELDAIYNAYNEITDAKDNAPEHQDAYSTIIAGTQGSESAKRLAAQFIPTFFKYFPTLHTKAIDGIFDLCEDDSSLIRQSAIKSLPSLCRDGPQHTIKIADVLCQLLQLDDQDLAVVQVALQTLMLQSPREVLAVLFRQGVNGADLRERTLDFITHHVMASKHSLFKDPEIEMFFVEEMQKAMGSVSNTELEIFAKIIMQTTPYQTGKLDLTGLLNSYVAHITSEKAFDVNDLESVKRVLVAGKLSMPLFKRAIPANPLLEFFAANVLPRRAFDRLTDKQKTSVLRLYADSVTTGHPSATILKSAGGLLTDLLVAIVPAEQESSTPVEFAQVECLTNVLHFIAIKEPELVEKEELTRRFRNLYMLTQSQISNLKQALAAAQAKKPLDAEQTAIIKSLTKTMLIHGNIHSAVKEFMKPRHLRNTKLVLHPSWKPVPEKDSLSASSASGAAKPVAPGAPKPTAGAVKHAAKASAKPGAKTMPVQQQNQQQQQHQQSGSSKRKAEQEPSAKPKKTKILRRHGSTGGASPRSSSPGGHASISTQSSHNTQHGKKGSIGRGQASPSSSFDSRRGRDSGGKISFLKR